MADSTLTKEQLEELGLLPNGGTDTLGGEKPSVEEEGPTPTSPPSIEEEGDTAKLLRQELEYGAQQGESIGLPRAHIARLDRATSGAYIVTLADFTGTIGIQLYWDRSVLKHLIKLALRMDPSLIIDEPEADGVNAGVHSGSEGVGA